MSYLFLQLKKHYNAVKQSRRLNKEQIKKQLIELFVSDDANKKELSARADAITDYRDAITDYRDAITDYREAMEIIIECETIIRTNKKKIIGFAYEQGKIFKKFKEDTNFKNLVEEFGISKSTIIFKLNMV